MKAKTHTSLSEMPRRNAFAVPEGFFEELPTAVLSRCSGSEVKRESLKVSTPLWWSVAACGLLLLGIWFVVPKATPSSDSLLAESEFFSVEMGDYLAQYVCPLVVAEEFYAQNIDFTPFWEELTEDDILEYLDFYPLNYDDYE